MDEVEELAEDGRETEKQRRKLRELGCERGQGYLFARPPRQGTRDLDSGGNAVRSVWTELGKRCHHYALRQGRLVRRPAPVRIQRVEPDSDWPITTTGSLSSLSFRTPMK